MAAVSAWAVRRALVILGALSVAGCSSDARPPGSTERPYPSDETLEGIVEELDAPTNAPLRYAPDRARDPASPSVPGTVDPTAPRGPDALRRSAEQHGTLERGDGGDRGVAGADAIPVYRPGQLLHPDVRETSSDGQADGSRQVEGPPSELAARP